MTNWTNRAVATIARVHERLPPSATLDERQAAVDAAYPFGGRSHWPYKAWLKARKTYLARYGYGARPSPLEVFIAQVTGATDVRA